MCGVRSMRASAHGIGLIEVLVSVLVLSVGLLGIAAMQSMALRGGQGSLERSQAVMQTTAIIEAMRGNRTNAASYNGTWNTPPTGSNVATRDLNEWVAGMQGVANWRGVTPAKPILATGAKGSISGCPDACVVIVEWDDSRAGGSTTAQLQTSARL